MRVQYIDKLKGFAIFLVVMGHIVEKGMGVTDSLFNQFYNSFHMPLFMFLSGLFALKSFKLCNINELFVFLKHKVLRVLLPFFVVGGFYSLLFVLQKEGEFVKALGNYWFLPALFYSMIIAAATNIFVKRVLKGKWYCDVLAHIIVWSLLNLLYIKGMLANITFSLHCLKLYPFFVLGIFYGRYGKFAKLVDDNKAFMSACLLLYFCSFLLPISIIKFPGFFAIIILMCLFKSYDTAIPNVLAKVGRYTMEIYVFHWFLLPSLNDLGTLLTSQHTELLDSGNFLILLLLSFLISVPIVGICILFAKILRESKYLNRIIFG